MAAYTTIDDPEAHFQVQLYTGNGSADHAITLGADTDMQPDFVWIKNRDAADSHCLFDAARGATEVLHADTNVIEATDADTLDSFTSDGFQVDADVKVNTNTEKYVSWNWNTQGGAGSSNTAGSINTTTTSVNTTSGFSISTYTGTGSAATIGHGLGAVPNVVIVKGRTIAASWRMYNSANNNTDYMVLNADDAKTTTGSNWNDTTATSSVFSLGTDAAINGSYNYVAYAWTEIQGFSKFGSYKGNGNADGTFVYTGFQPAFILIKNLGAGESWQMLDPKRSTFNPADDIIMADIANAESAVSGRATDFLSNGFKFRGTEGGTNAVATYIYMAFAEAPFVNSNGVPCNAR